MLTPEVFALITSVLINIGQFGMTVFNIVPELRKRRLDNESKSFDNYDHIVKMLMSRDTDMIALNRRVSELEATLLTTKALLDSSLAREAELVTRLAMYEQRIITP